MVFFFMYSTLSKHRTYDCYRVGAVAKLLYHADLKLGGLGVELRMPTLC